MEKLSSRSEQLWRSFTNSRSPDDDVGQQLEPYKPASSISKHLAYPLVGDSAKLPCVVLPSIRTSRFFDRIDVIKKIEDHFSMRAPGTSFRSLALHGLGGVGKSTVALKYAEEQLRCGELDALFWVYSEKLVSIKQSFTNIAFRLKLPDARRGDHDENRAVVLNWLQHTRP